MNTNNNPKLDEALRQNAPMMIAYAKRMLGNREDAEDAWIDACRRVVERWDSFEADKPLRPWLLGFVRNSSLDILRRRTKMPPTDWEGSEGICDFADGSTASPLKDVEELLTQVITLQLLGLAKARVFWLCEIDEGSYADAAEALDIPVTRVRWLLHEARETLKDLPEKKKKRIAAFLH